jgi:hypothetical protein
MLIPLPAFQDNDPWMVHDGRRVLLAGPGDARPVLACLQRDRLQLDAILVTALHACDGAAPQSRELGAAIPLMSGRCRHATALKQQHP